MKEGERRDKHYDVRQRGYRQSVIIPPPHPTTFPPPPPPSFPTPLFPAPGTGPALASGAARRNPKANTGHLNLFTAARFVYVMRTGAVNSSHLPPEKQKRCHAAYVKGRRVDAERGRDGSLVVVCLAGKEGREGQWLHEA